MGGSGWLLGLVEMLLVLGAALGFGWWQLRSVERDRREAGRRRRAGQDGPAP
jgi:hypothetical protein